MIALISVQPGLKYFGFKIVPAQLEGFVNSNRYKQ